MQGQWPQAPAAPPARSAGKAVAIVVGWLVAGIVFSVLGAAFLMVALNGYTSVGSLTIALWLAVSPALTIFGGVPVSIAYARGASSSTVGGIAMAALCLAGLSWIAVLWVAPQ